ncbi:MAG: SPOR domain-containing protein [Amylibacter sp.]|nr:SPOR domain-containing protein [Amylibacter sp.]
MSEYEEQYNQADYVAPFGLVRLGLNWLGAIASIALVVGLVYWVFQLGTRNPNEIPIIQAMKGPARTQPNEPGGTQASHQGLAVNAVQSEGSAEQSAQTVILAPDQQPLTSEDVAQGALTNTQPVLRPVPDAPKQTVEDEIVAAVEAAPTPTVQDPTLIIESIVVKNSSLVISSSEFAPLKSPIPHNRPNALVRQIEDATTIAAQSETVITSVPVGTRLVQLGAYDSEAIATKEWDKLIGKHGDLMTGKKRLVQSASSGGRIFYRLRAMGFDTIEDSRNLCSALLARGIPCIPVAAR